MSQGERVRRTYARYCTSERIKEAAASGISGQCPVRDRCGLVRAVRTRIMVPVGRDRRSQREVEARGDAVVVGSGFLAEVASDRHTRRSRPSSGPRVSGRSTRCWLRACFSTVRLLGAYENRAYRGRRTAGDGWGSVDGWASVDRAVCRSVLILKASAHPPRLRAGRARAQASNQSHVPADRLRHGTASGRAWRRSRSCVYDDCL